MSMQLVERFQLTPKQAAFAVAFAETYNATRSAELAGYAKDNAQQEGWRLLRLPHVVAATQYEARRLLTVGVPEMLALVQHIARDESVSARVRLDAAKTWLDRAGLVPPRAAAASKGEAETPLHERSAEDLRELANRLESELAGRAKTVNAPKAPAGDSYLSDFIG